MEDRIERKKSYFLGIIGGIIGGIIAAIPLAFCYVYSEWLFLLALTILIPIFEFYGYKWLKGKVNSKLPIILLILTFITVSIMVLLLIPLGLLIKSNLPISVATIKNLYANRSILLNILQDYLFSLVFGILGVYIVGTIIKRKLLLNMPNINLFSSDNKEKQEFKEKSIDELKPVFEKYGAIQKEKTITKEEILADFKENKYNDYFEYLKQLDIIRKYKGKYYYSSDDEKNIKIHYSVSKIVVTICTAIILIVAIMLSFGGIMNKEVKKVYNDDVSFNIDTSWNLFEDYTEDAGWIYYKYLDTDGKENSEHSYPATIGIVYDKSASGNYNSINDLRSILEIYINEYLDYDGYNINVFTTSNGYDAIELMMKYETTMEFDYYIYQDGKIAYITAISYTNSENILDELEEYTKDVVNSFEWNK